jgi:hypothetical protein
MTATTKTTAYVEERSQKSVGSGAGGFGGPDTYVAVQVVPAGAERLKALNTAVAEKRGIEIIYCGEGYSQSCKTTRSALGAARAEAQQVADRINSKGT